MREYRPWVTSRLAWGVIEKEFPNCNLASVSRDRGELRRAESPQRGPGSNMGCCDHQDCYCDRRNEGNESSTGIHSGF